MLRTWSGVLAHLDTKTTDGRELRSEQAADPLMWGDPTPLLDGRSGQSMDPAAAVGTVDRLWIDDGDLCGSGTVDVSEPFEWRGALLGGLRVPVGLRADVDRWRTDGTRVQGWQVRYVLMTTEPPWKNVGIRLDA